MSLLRFRPNVEHRRPKWKQHQAATWKHWPRHVPSSLVPLDRNHELGLLNARFVLNPPHVRCNLSMVGRNHANRVVVHHELERFDIVCNLQQNCKYRIQSGNAVESPIHHPSCNHGEKQIEDPHHFPHREGMLEAHLPLVADTTETPKKTIRFSKLQPKTASLLQYPRLFQQMLGTHSKPFANKL